MSVPADTPPEGRQAALREYINTTLGLGLALGKDSAGSGGGGNGKCGGSAAAVGEGGAVPRVASQADAGELVHVFSHIRMTLHVSHAAVEVRVLRWPARPAAACRAA